MATVYLILGAPGTAQAELLAYLLRQGIDAPEHARVIVEDAQEAAFTAVWESAHVKAPLTVVPTLEEALETLDTGEADPVFFAVASLTDPRPALEALREWLYEGGHDLARILTIADCEALSEHPGHGGYYEVCLHFSDIYLLGNRAAVSKKWIQEYQNSLKKLSIPAQIELIKKGGKVDDVNALLFPEARRLSQVFDQTEEDDATPGFEMIGMSNKEEEAEDPRDPQFDPMLARGEDGHYRHRYNISAQSS